MKKCNYRDCRMLRLQNDVYIVKCILISNFK